MQDSVHHWSLIIINGKLLVFGMGMCPCRSELLIGLSMNCLQPGNWAGEAGHNQEEQLKLKTGILSMLSSRFKFIMWSFFLFFFYFFFFYCKHKNKQNNTNTTHSTTFWHNANQQRLTSCSTQCMCFQFTSPDHTISYRCYLYFTLQLPL